MKLPIFDPPGYIRLLFAILVTSCRRTETYTPAAAFGIIAGRIETRIQTLQNMRLDGYNMVISELVSAE